MQVSKKLLSLLRTGLQHSSMKQVSNFFTSFGGMLTHNFMTSEVLNVSNPSDGVFCGYWHCVQMLREKESEYRKLRLLLEHLSNSMTAVRNDSCGIRVHQLRANTDGLYSSDLLDKKDWEAYDECIDRTISQCESAVDLVEIAHRLIQEIYGWVEGILAINLEDFRLSPAEKKIICRLVEIQVYEKSANHILDSGNFRKRCVIFRH